MFDGKLEVRKAFDHSLVMRGIEEERLIKLQGTSARGQHFSYNSHYEEGTLPSSLLWQAGWSVCAIRWSFPIRRLSLSNPKVA